MIDFIEYVVAEVKSKRLSKANATELIGQFTLRASRSAAGSIIHPLLHSNTSDLSEQRHTSTFTGEEFFLTDHQVKGEGHRGQKVLPGVAYLEMARVAMEQAFPVRPEATALELRDTVWAQPIVVREEKQISIVLLPKDEEEIEYEIYSGEPEQEIVHCRGRAVWSHQPAAARLDLDQLKGQMGQGQMEPSSLYAACARMGLVYGPTFQAITAIHRGGNQVLAHLRLPSGAEDRRGEYVLHPSLMDGALQACVGLMNDSPEGFTQPRLPFALDSLLIVSPCTQEMFAWVRYARGSQAADKVVKLDIDVCDERGNVCVQMRGFSSRVLSQEISTTAVQEKAIGSLVAAPVWQARPVQEWAGGSSSEFAEHHIILCELSQVNAEKLGPLLPQSQCLSLEAGEQNNVGQRYSEYAVACFERIRTILQSKPQRKVLVQVVVPEDGEQAVLLGLSGLLRTAALENPQLIGQVTVVGAEMTTEELAQRLEEEKRGGGREAQVRYEAGVRQVLGWQEIEAGGEERRVGLQEEGVYLITGGLGGLGLLFAKEILERTRQVRVVLTGRWELSAGKQARLEGLSPHLSRLSYRQVDLGDLDQVKHLIVGIQAEYGRLNGILHTAGQIADNFIMKKDSGEFREVLRPKVTGTYNLDEASGEVELDFLVLFSSVAGAMGNVGQADYATANGFMDQFARYRNREVAEGRRRGRTRAINWGLWQAGGMGMDASSLELLRQTAGLQPMQTAVGMEAFYRSLAMPYDQMLVVEGDVPQLRRALLSVPALAAEPHLEQAVVAAGMDAESLAEKTQEYLRRQFSGLLKMPWHRIDPQAALENYGIDSILALKLTNQLEQTFGPLSKTLLFEYQTIRELTEYFSAHYSTQLTALFATTTNRAGNGAAPSWATVQTKPISSRRFSRLLSVAPSRMRESVAIATKPDPIAIIGMSGRYPEAINLEAFWQNLRAGKDCIVEVPKERWNWREYFSDDRSKSGHHYSKWGGFIAGVDEFDPLFFNISPFEAEFIDPQERLFLQHAWMAIEDAGYTRAGLQVSALPDLTGQVGVYAGVMYSEYQLFAAEGSMQGQRMGIAGSIASIANRVSYTLNLHGPSMTLDTMCSSSLSAIHIACQDLKQQRTSLAVAGGVNVSIHPNKYLALSAGQFISSDGHCQSFGEGGDGYIPGEGVGVLVLKRLSDAKRDGDHIYGIIRGSALNHGGKTNGYTVPNPQAQASVISRALAESGTDAGQISYIEAHGTGTKLGDPIEIAALSKAFQQYTQEKSFCRIGSVKSNIGHCESAAGIAGLTKVLLQMQHQEIVPSLHSRPLNPHIDFGESPFVVNQELRRWERPVVEGREVPRIAGISSFGAGGSNVHLIVEEYEGGAGQREERENGMDKAVVILSAQRREQLKQKARELLEFVRSRRSRIDLPAMAYTLQVGREAMEERLGLVVGTVDELLQKLEAYLGGEQEIDDVHEGGGKGNKETFSLFSTDADLQQTVEKWLANRKFSKLLELWVKGLGVDWSTLYRETRPQRISLPTYPFARERYWIDTARGGQVVAPGAAAAVLHPLLHRNTSDLSEQRYNSIFTGNEFFLRDHQVGSEGHTVEKVLPGVAYLEMVRAAVELAWPARSESNVLELHNVVWAQPIVVSESKQVNIALLVNDHEEIGYEIYSPETDREMVHCQGGAMWSQPRGAPAKLDLEQLKGEMGQGRLEPSSFYGTCAGMGLVYGPAFQGIIAIDCGSGQVLAQLRLPRVVEETWGHYVLHPSLMDGALQAAIGLTDGGSEGSKQPRVPFALDCLRVMSGCSREMYAWVRYAPGRDAGDKIVKLDIDLCDERGVVCVQMQGLSSRLLSQEIRTVPAQGRVTDRLLAIPVWQASSVETGNASNLEYWEHHVIVCGLTNVKVEELRRLLPQSQCLSLPAEEQKSIAQCYSEYALACFERIKAILQGKPLGKVLVQIVIAGHQEEAVLAGLSGLLNTAAQENPQIVDQLIFASPETTAEELARQLLEEKTGGLRGLIRYENSARRVLAWQEVAAEAEKPPIAFQDHGVYLITGGLGALGLLFAKEILAQTHQGRVVLTGRSALSMEKQAQLEGLSGQAERVSYRQVDLGDLDQVKRLITGIEQDCGQLKGILHAAGSIADNFILKKTEAEFSQVLKPKVTGTYNLDQASRNVKLDFFVLFSSLAGAIGNVGQADYATANAFMDQFATYRNGQVAAQKRHGRTRSINWPLWQAGGMLIDAATQERLRQTTGLQPMQTATGMETFHRSLSWSYNQVMVLEGDLVQIRRTLLAGRPALSEPQTKQALEREEIDGDRLREKTQEYLRRQFSGLLKLPAHKIDPQAALDTYGIDSILAMKLTNQLEKAFGSLSKTLFFEYQTIAALAGYFVKAHPAIVREVGLLHEEPKGKDVQTWIEGKRAISAAPSKSRFLFSAARCQEEIAIIGISGRYPQAENLQEFWKNLQNGRDCITEIPSERWDNTLYFDPDRNKLGKSYSKWGGFIADVDKFDPLFFNISPKEAELIDPQERLFLETVWKTIEDAGYSKDSLCGKRVGVFVGVMWGQYELFGAESILSGDTAIPSSSHASVANRVSYFFDFHGPSIALDTMCSSSMTAIYLACQELRNGTIDAAIAGGVNVTIHPYKYLSLSQGKFAASDGKCRSFGEGGDGYVPGEGVGAVLLKPLANALRDRDQVYAVIKSSTINHGGKTNGYTVPNPNAQGDLIREAVTKAHIDPRTLSYIETHGTGTSLGDPIEIAGLLKAYEGITEKQFCPIGSVKSNIGHLESAAGIAAISKALLQIRYKQLVPSLHADPLNPNINFKDSPFYVQTELTEWKGSPSSPRRVGVSSFGAGGSNAHLVLEEYAQSTEPTGSLAASREVCIFSAKDQDALCRQAESMISFLENACHVSLADMAYTLQVGRTPMDARLGMVTSSLEDLKGKLVQWINFRSKQGVVLNESAAELEDVFSGHIKGRFGVRDLIEGRAGTAFLEDLLTRRNLQKIARLWVLGVDIDWVLMHRHSVPKRVSLPTYPFAKERCWVNYKPLAHSVVQGTNLSVKESIAQEPDPKQRTYYLPQWTVKPVSVRDEKLALGPILILDSSEQTFRKMKGQLEISGDHSVIMLVRQGKPFREIEPNVYDIDPAREEQFHDLVQHLKGRDLLPRVIVHHDSEVCDLEDALQVDQHLNNGVYALFYLCKSLIKAKHQMPLKILSVFSSDSLSTVPLNAAIGGFLKTLSMENPRYLVKAVDIEKEAGKSEEVLLAEKANVIWDEIHDENWTAPEILYRIQREASELGHTRYVNELVPQAPDRTNLSALPLKPTGVYLITGGLGGLGSIFSVYLAKGFHARLVLVGRSAPNAGQQEKIRQLKSYGAEVLPLQADVSNLEQIQEVIRETKAQFGKIDGVIHSAGVNRDAFILKKTKGEIESVLASKVYGTINVDLATSHERLDFFVLFSSVAGVMGNYGQSDYAYANHFMDSFAERRESLRKAQKRSGRTLSINWPLWEAGGMNLSPDDIELLEKRTGICPMPTQEGMQYWEDFLRSEALQGVALYGIPSRIAAYIAQRSAKAAPEALDSRRAVDIATLFAKTEAYLKALIGEEIKLAPERIGSSDRLESFGIDSVMINRLNANLERDLGALPKTLLYEHETVAEVAQFLLQQVREALITHLDVTASTSEPASPSFGPGEQVIQPAASTAQINDNLEQIAIIGIHGYYPHSENLDELWENLKQGKTLIDLVPPNRWSYQEFYDQDPAAATKGKIYCKWGGFLDDYDKFDAPFFNISPEEARIMDPQERLFLESVWAAIEDAGYTRDSLRKRFAKGRGADIGVFVGVTTNSYHLWAPEERSRGNYLCPTAMPWSIANRVSYFFDFNGPSMPVDTACSSSLVAVHLACESLKRRECQIAIAGGVNLYLHPYKYQSLCQNRMLSLDGMCHSYGAGDDGFVPGEGVGTLVLKQLSKAIADHDQIYSVIRASAYDHSGRSKGYSAPNPNAQANVISRALRNAQIPPESVACVEGHGTGTQLGDSLEVAALAQAFQKQTAKKQFCSIGSVKANIGHSESAAGIASLTKAVLQIQRRQLVPSLCSDPPNPNIEFEKTPFYLQHRLSEWESSPGIPRRALINSFGAGGVNACVILEEYEKPNLTQNLRQTVPYLFVLSARNEQRLQEYADHLLAWLKSHPDFDLASLCYTLQVGREAMGERLAMVVSDAEELIDLLSNWSQPGSPSNIYRGNLGTNRASKSRLNLLKVISGEQSLIEIASMWASGQDMDWETLYPTETPFRVSLPVYPFARERYWISDSLVREKPDLPNAQVHPLISYNSSTLRGISFSSRLSDGEFYALDHEVNEERIFPGAGFLEMACFAGNIAGEQRVRKLKDTVWIHPLTFRKGPPTLQILLKPGVNDVKYEISSLDEEDEAIVYSEGRLIFGSVLTDVADDEDRISLEALKAQCSSRLNGSTFYEEFRKSGLNYGPSFRSVQEIFVSDSFALAKLKLADHLRPRFGQFILHPSLIDGAWQTAAGLIGNRGLPAPYLPFVLDEVDILHPLRQTCYAYAEFADFHGPNPDGVRKFNIRLVNESGDVLVRFKHLFCKALAPSSPKLSSLVPAALAGKAVAS